MFLLARQALEDLEELGGGGIQSVIEFDLVDFGGLFPAKCLFTKIGDFAMNVEVQPLKVMEVGRQREHFRAQSRAHLEGGSAGVVIELANLVGGRIGIVAHGDFDEFRAAGRKEAAKSELCGRGCRDTCSKKEKNKASGQKRGRAFHRHRVVEMPEGWERVAIRIPPVLLFSPEEVTAETETWKRWRTLSAWRWQRATARASAASAGSG